MNIATIILAAGGSSRMGCPKQLLPFRGRTLVAHAASIAFEAQLGPVIVVVGFEEERVREAFAGMPVRTCTNPDWASGMGSSIKAGIAEVAANPKSEAAIIMLADQPLVDSSVLARLAEIHAKRGCDAVACAYSGSVGVPALFDRRVFSRLADIPHQHGAKQLLNSLGGAVATIDCPQAAADIDTPEDFHRVSGTAESPAFKIQAWTGDRFDSRSDSLAIEEPLEVRIRNKSVGITMRTPGNDEELAAGLLLSEGLVRTPADILGIDPCARNEHGNAINVRVAPLVNIDFDALARHVITSSACGVCGKASIDAVRDRISAVQCRICVSAAMLCSLPEAMRAGQRTFSETGGLHAAAVFDSAGHMLVLREDVGRHNAVDKAVGRLFLEGRTPLPEHILLVSGRASFEIMQKAAAAGIGIVAAVSAPSSLAVAFAQEMDQTLIGFLRPPRFNVYAHPERISA